MICPHCSQNILYKERSGKKCSKCNREFAFEPKTAALGLHDVRFRKAMAKISGDGKLYFTQGQLQHFLSRKKIKNSFHAIRGWLAFAAVAIVAAILFLAVAASLTALYFLAVLVAVVSVIGLSVFWQKESELSLPQDNREFERDVVGRWRSIYGQLSPHFAAKNQLPDATVEKNLRGVLVCPEPEVLLCLAANRLDHDLGLLLINLYQSADKLDLVRNRRDLPIFVLHDASVEGSLLKDEFVRTHLNNDRRRQVYDIGLRPQNSLKANLMRLRGAPSANDLTANLPALTPAEIAWLQKGNYTPLLALPPAQLIKLVTNAVKKRSQVGSKNVVKDNQNEAHAVGFMTWLGGAK